MSPVTVTISLGGFSWTGGTLGVSFGMADWLRVRRIARRRAADCSFGSDWSPEWTSMTKAELTAENRPAYKDELSGRWQRTIEITYEDQGGVEVLVVLFDIVRIILGRLLLVHGVEIETGVVVLDGLEECSESILETAFVQRRVVEAM